MTYPELVSEFIKIYGGTDEGVRIFEAPGRINLIGEQRELDFPMLMVEAEIFGSVNMRDFGENNTAPLKPLPKGNALALYRLAEDPLVYDGYNIDNYVMDQFERFTGNKRQILFN